jgi:aspartyl/asparaginyl-tRNA synthetase
MSQYLLIKKVYETKPVDQVVTVKGWVKSLRQSKKFSFLVLNDGTTQKDLQIIVRLQFVYSIDVSCSDVHIHIRNFNGIY